MKQRLQNIAWQRGLFLILILFAYNQWGGYLHGDRPLLWYLPPWIGESRLQIQLGILVLQLPSLLLHGSLGFFLSGVSPLAILRKPRGWRLAPPYVVLALLQLPLCAYLIYLPLISLLGLKSLALLPWLPMFFFGYCLARSFAFPQPARAAPAASGKLRRWLGEFPWPRLLFILLLLLFFDKLSTQISNAVKFNSVSEAHGKLYVAISQSLGPLIYFLIGCTLSGFSPKRLLARPRNWRLSPLNLLLTALLLFPICLPYAFWHLNTFLVPKTLWYLPWLFPLLLGHFLTRSFRFAEPSPEPAAVIDAAAQP